jgi:hypothetical protein
MTQRPNPYSNTCRVEVEIPWELTEALIPILSKLLNTLMSAVEPRSEKERLGTPKG